MAVEEKTAAQHAAEYEEFAGHAAEYDSSIGTEATALLQALLGISHRLADLTEAVRESMDLTIYDGSEES